MKKAILLTSFLVTICSLSSCGTNMPEGTKLLNDVKSVEKFNYDLTKNENFLKIVDAQNTFSGTISEAIFKETDTNFAISPASIYLDLGVLASLSNGLPKDEILNALNIDFETLEQYYNDFFSSLNFSNDDCNIYVTNSAWIDSKYKFKDEVAKSLAEKYYTYLYETTFSTNLENAKKALNLFIKEKTEGLIDIELEVVLTTPLVLLNTLYFKDVWEDELDFKKEVNFVNSDKTTTKLSLLKGETESGLPYVSEKYTTFYATMKNGNKIHFILPNDGYDLDDIMTKEVINEVINITDYHFKTGGYLNETIPFFPEFKIDYQDSIEDYLKEYLNIKGVFDQQTTGLSNVLSDGPSLYVDKVAHAATLEVSKKGVEGAGMTGIITGPTSSGPSNDPVEFIVDRAFGVVVENRYGSTIFTGAVRNL